MVMLLLGLLYTSAVVASGGTISGKVSSNGRGISGVVVSDGYSVVKTSSNGKFSMNISPDARFVFVSCPAGYEVPTLNSVPQFYKKVEHPNHKSYDFELTKLAKSDARYRLIVWADPQVKRPSDLVQLRDAAEDLKKLIASDTTNQYIAVGCGDIVFDRLNLFKEHNDAVSKVGIPFYQTIGNHDLDYGQRSNDLSKQSFEDVYGPRYYSFNRGKIHYVVLDNVFNLGHSFYYIGYLEEQQMRWLEKDLAFVPQGSSVVVSLHIPTAVDSADVESFSFENITNSQSNNCALYSLLKGYRAHIISGHMHNTINVNISKDLVERIHSSVCGSWWYGKVAQDGTPNGYGVATIVGDSITWQFKAIGYPIGYQLRCYNVGENKEQPNFITANVWNWNSSWKVYWYEDGIKMGEMEQYKGYDVETLRSYENIDNHVPKWVKPVSTSHLFRAKPINSNAKVTVEAIDEYGNRFWSR